MRMMVVTGVSLSSHTYITRTSSFCSAKRGSQSRVRSAFAPARCSRGRLSTRGIAAISSFVGAITTPEPCKRVQRFERVIVRGPRESRLIDPETRSSAPKRASGKESKTCEILKYQLGCPAHSTSKSSRQSKASFTFLRFEFIDDGPVVNPSNRIPVFRPALVVKTRQPSFLMSTISTVCTPSNLLRQQEIRQRLLMQGSISIRMTFSGSCDPTMARRSSSR